MYAELQSLLVCGHVSTTPKKVTRENIVYIEFVIVTTEQLTVYYFYRLSDPRAFERSNFIKWRIHWHTHTKKTTKNTPYSYQRITLEFEQRVSSNKNKWFRMLIRYVFWVAWGCSITSFIVVSSQIINKHQIRVTMYVNFAV